MSGTRSTHRYARLTTSLIAAVGTLFNPVARIEAVQGMSRSTLAHLLRLALLAAFSEAGWLPGGGFGRVARLTLGHAVRMAIDMGVNRSFIQLLRTGMGKSKSREELEDERHLVVHSRVWFYVRCWILTS